MPEDKIGLHLSERERRRVNEVFSDIEGVIWDMDGLMVDSEQVHRKAYDAILQRFGYGLSETENTQRYVGVSDSEISIDLINRLGLSIRPEELVRLKEAADLELLPGVNPQSGLFDLLQRLQERHLRSVIASSSSLEIIELVVDSLRIRNFFEGFTSAKEVKLGKPAPDVFLLAAERLRLPPNKCLVLEDAPSGIEAAGLAGMRSIAIPSRETKSRDFIGATLRLGNLSQIAAFLGR